MKTTTLVTALFAAALLVAPIAGMAQANQNRAGNDQAMQRAQAERGQRDMGADRMRDRDRLGAAEQDRDRIQDRTHAPDSANQQDNSIYGYNLMSEEERNAYREQIRNAKSQQEREQIEARHRHEMQVRAENAGVEIPEPAKTQKGKDD